METSFPHWRGCKMLVKYYFWTTGKYRMRSVIHVLLRWITNFFLSSIELCRTVVRKSSIRVFTCRRAWHPKFWQKLPICSACYFNLEGLEVCLGGGLAHKRPLVATGMEFCSGTNMFFDEWQTVTHYTDVWLVKVTVAVDCIALNCWGKHKRKMAIRGKLTGKQPAAIKLPHWVHSVCY